MCQVLPMCWAVNTTHISLLNPYHTLWGQYYCYSPCTDEKLRQGEDTLLAPGLTAHSAEVWTRAIMIQKRSDELKPQCEEHRHTIWVYFQAGKSSGLCEK